MGGDDVAIISLAPHQAGKAEQSKQADVIPPVILILNDGRTLDAGVVVAGGWRIRLRRGRACCSKHQNRGKQSTIKINHFVLQEAGSSLLRPRTWETKDLLKLFRLAVGRALHDGQ